MFEQHFEPVSQDNPSSGRIALIPWDIETFGFGVADFQIDYSEECLKNVPRIREQIEKWTKRQDVELVGTTVATEDSVKLSFIQSLGFCYIDTTVWVHYRNVKDSKCPESEIEVVPAGKTQLDAVVEISGRVFKTGRYHNDNSFPKELADKRYQDWVRRAFAGSDNQKLLTAVKNNEVCAFLVTRIEGKKGKILLNAVAPNWQGKGTGAASVAAALCYFKKQGVESVDSKISVSNIRVLNLHSKLGAEFDNPQVLLHWHRPGARHLVK
jgi:GNAT superfamily N-acetyltransferase